MKTIIASLSLLLIIQTISFAETRIPEKYQGEWVASLISQDGGCSYRNFNTSIGVMRSTKMISRGQDQIFDAIQYDFNNDYMVLSFRDAPAVWEVSNINGNRYSVKVNRVENGSSKYLFTMIVDIMP